MFQTSAFVDISICHPAMGNCTPGALVMRDARPSARVHQLLWSILRAWVSATAASRAAVCYTSFPDLRGTGLLQLTAIPPVTASLFELLWQLPFYSALGRRLGLLLLFFKFRVCGSCVWTEVLLLMAFSNSLLFLHLPYSDFNSRLS